MEKKCVNLCNKKARSSHVVSLQLTTFSKAGNSESFEPIRLQYTQKEKQSAKSEVHFLTLIFLEISCPILE